MEAIVLILKFLVDEIEFDELCARFDLWNCTYPRNAAQVKFERIVMSCASDDEIGNRLIAEFFGFVQVRIWHLPNETIITMKDHYCAKWLHGMSIPTPN